MLPGKALFFIALLAAQLAFPTDLGTEGQLLSFARMALPENSSISTEEFAYNNSTAYVVNSAGQAQFVLMHSLSGDAVPLSNASEIKSALYDYYFSRGSLPISFSDFEALHSGILHAREKYKSGEDKCRVLTGTDRTKCVDFYSCQQACYSVTSFCLPIALGSGKDFVNVIWEFENNSRALDAAYAAEEAAYGGILKNTTKESVEAYLFSLEGVNRASTSAELSPLYDGYSYCFTPDYSLPEITGIQLAAQKYYQRAGPLFSLEAISQEMGSRTAAAIKKIRAAASGAKNATVKNESLNASSANASAAQKPAAQPESKDNSLALAAGGIALLSIIAAAVLFILSKKRKHSEHHGHHKN